MLRGVYPRDERNDEHQQDQAPGNPLLPRAGAIKDGSPEKLECPGKGCRGDESDVHERGTAAPEVDGQCLIDETERKP